jgi:hypothetical protein
MSETTVTFTAFQRHGNRGHELAGEENYVVLPDAVWQAARRAVAADDRASEFEWPIHEPYPAARPWSDGTPASEMLPVLQAGVAALRRSASRSFAVSAVHVQAIERLCALVERAASAGLRILITADGGD